MKNIVILISGRGSNMEAIVRAAIPGSRIAAVISNRPDAAGLGFAASHGIATAVVDRPGQL
jgi:phosphoribosylglycinamide formyltransferase 1